jgi:hypothetical protein
MRDKLKALKRINIPDKMIEYSLVTLNVPNKPKSTTVGSW